MKHKKGLDLVKIITREEKDLINYIARIEITARN
jgi:hypothetical protein